MIDVTFTFNNVDLSPYLSTYKVTYVIEDMVSVKTMDGTEYVASKIRPVIEFTLIPVTDAQAANIYTALSPLLASCTYTDPNRNTNATAQMRVASDIDKVFGLRSIDGNRYYKGGTITLRQRTVL